MSLSRQEEITVGNLKFKRMKFDEGHPTSWEALDISIDNPTDRHTLRLSYSPWRNSTLLVELHGVLGDFDELMKRLTVQDMPIVPVPEYLLIDPLC